MEAKENHDSTDDNKKENSGKGKSGDKSKKKKYRRKHSKDYQRIDDICYAEGFLGEDVFNKAFLMFEDYGLHKFKKTYGVIKNPTKEQIKKSKQSVRDKLLTVMSKPFTEAQVEQKMLVEEVLSYEWFLEKLDYALEEIADFHKSGKLYKDLLNATYFKPKTDNLEEIYRSLYLGESTYYAKRREAIMLFGIMLWKYAKRREYEDMAKGIIPQKPLYPDRPGDKRPERRKRKRKKRK